MRGRRVLRRAGWDTHGLPVEVEVEKRLGFSGKDQIEAYGVAEFVQRCRESVLRLRRGLGAADRADRLLGRHLRRLLDPDPRLCAVGVVASPPAVGPRADVRGRQGCPLLPPLRHRPVEPRAGPARRLPRRRRPERLRPLPDHRARAPEGAEALLVWTTTPWTLLSNTGVAVNPDLTYVVVDGMVVAESRADAVLGAGAAGRATPPVVAVRSLSVSATGGPSISSPSPTAPTVGGSSPADFVTGDEGTGLVHLAPAFGADDWALGRAENLPALNPVGPDGRFTAAAGGLAGSAVRAADAEIVGRSGGRRPAAA